MPELPTGTVTFLFTDVEASTALAHRLPHDFQDVLVEHRSLVRAAVVERDGVEIDVRGDEFFVWDAKTGRPVLDGRTSTPAG